MVINKKTNINRNDTKKIVCNCVWKYLHNYKKIKKKKICIDLNKNVEWKIVL